MKKALFTLAAAVAAVASSYGQGYVVFGNQAGVTSVAVNSAGALSTFTPTANTASPSYYYALFYATSSSATFNGSSAGVVGTPTGDTVNSFVTGSSLFTQDAGVLGVNNTAGRTGGGFADSNPNNIANGTPVPAGTQDAFIVLGWSANIGSTIASVQSFLNGTDTGVTSGFIGQSPVGVVTLSPGGNVAINNLFSSGTAGDKSIPGFDLGYVSAPTPEPTSIALGVMGGLSLLALRRKKA